MKEFVLQAKREIDKCKFVTLTFEFDSKVISIILIAIVIHIV